MGPKKTKKTWGFQEADDVTAEPDAFGGFLAGAGMANEFSLCMGGPGSPGLLVLGGVDSEYQVGSFQIVGIRPGGGYAVPVAEVTVGRHRLGSLDADEQAAIFASAGAIVDSGTPELVLPASVYGAMASSIVPCADDGDCVIGIALSGGATLAAPGIATCGAGGTCRATRWVRSSGGPQAILGHFWLGLDLNLSARHHAPFSTHRHRPLDAVAVCCACGPQPMYATRLCRGLIAALAAMPTVQSRSAPPRPGHSGVGRARRRSPPRLWGAVRGLHRALVHFDGSVTQMPCY